MSEIIRGIIDGKFVETLGPFIREKIRRVLAKTRLIFSRINGPSKLLIQFIVNNTVEFYLSFFFLYLCFGICLPELSCQ